MVSHLIILVGQISDLVAQGNKMMDEQKFDLALGFFEQALLLDQGDADLWNHKGVALRSMGRYEEAVECFNRSLAIDPRDRDAS